MTTGAFEHIRLNLEEVRGRIESAAKRAGKAAEDVTLVAVSKTFGEDAVREAFSLGVTHFGESYVQEAVDKIGNLEIDPEWRFIGHLQSNKVRSVVKAFNCIDSVDSEKLLKRIDFISGEEGKIMNLLLQVNVAGEERKFGIDPDEVGRLLEGAADLSNVKIRGFMLIPPFYDNPEMNRKNFADLRELWEKFKGIKITNWEPTYLSMGMTDDFEIAIEEGSNMVRTGRAIFGPRRRK